VLDTIKILPFEGAGYGRELHRQAAVLAATGALRNGKYQEALGLLTKARDWPEHLGVGKPYDVDNRIEDYLEACCRMRMGDSLQARALFQNVVRATSPRNDRDAQYFLSLLAQRTLGQGAEAAASLKEWSEAEPMDLVARWAIKTMPPGGQNSRASAGSAEASSAGPWNPIPSDPSFPMVKEIASLSLE
jgi:tetratricopeptide (TPR) repeat protein